MSGHRRKSDIVIGIDQFEADVTAMHSVLNGYVRSLRIGSDHYRAIHDLQQNLHATIRTVTGRELPWVRMPTKWPAR